jgi:peptidoglycan-associated lipoprotein
MTGKRSLAAVVALTLVLAACKKDPPPQPTPGGGSQTPTTPVGGGGPTGGGNTGGGNTGGGAANYDTELRTVLTEIVYFDYDVATIRSDAKASLDRKVQILRTNPNVMLRVEGHADERGSVEYNLALSLRRANAIRDYLAGFQLDATRFEVVPLGEERPAASGTSEADYARNRRGEFQITAGGTGLRRTT